MTWPFGVAVEDQRGGVAVRVRLGEHAARDLAVEQPADHGAPVHGPLDRAVADDQRQPGRQVARDRAGKWVTAAGDQGDVDATGNRVVDGAAVGGGHPSVAVEQGAVDVDANQPDHAEIAYDTPFRRCLTPADPGARRTCMDRLVRTAPPSESLRNRVR
jgi:hypothetical protein